MRGKRKCVLADAGNRRKREEIKDMDKRKSRMDKHAVAVGFARMWGVMETLEDIGSASQQEVCDTVTAWAEEFITGGQSDLVDFFDRKAKAVKKGWKPDSEGCGGDDEKDFCLGCALRQGCCRRCGRTADAELRNVQMSGRLGGPQL